MNLNILNTQSEKQKTSQTASQRTNCISLCGHCYSITDAQLKHQSTVIARLHQGWTTNSELRWLLCSSSLQFPIICELYYSNLDRLIMSHSRCTVSTFVLNRTSSECLDINPTQLSVALEVTCTSSRWYVSSYNAQCNNTFGLQGQQLWLRKTSYCPLKNGGMATFLWVSHHLS